jgi:RNA polymerase sigma factor (TIGR02999 family)
MGWAGDSGAMDPKEASPGLNLTQLLTAWREGEPQALTRLTPLIYEELRRLAHGFMRGERAGHTLQATAIVHEAFMRLVQSNVSVQDRTHLFALVSRLMRHVLVDYSKARSSDKRGSGLHDVALDEIEAPAQERPLDVVALDEALERLARVEPRLAQVLELFYFGGLTYDEIAVAVGISTATVHRDIRLGRAWLLNKIGGSSR